jgi:GSCFA family
MEWHTELHVSPNATKISYNEPIFCIGSCFASNLSQKLNINKFIAYDGFGTVFNPLSIFELLRWVIHPEKNIWKKSNYFLDCEGGTLHYGFHSHFYATSQPKLEQYLEDFLTESRQDLQKSRWLVITLGTAWAYFLKEQDLLVANCHKQPAILFDKKLLSLSFISQAFEDLIQDLRAFNPDLEIILTVSPVRHTKDGLCNNAVSKSLLRLFCHDAVDRHSNVHYFPSYELMVDDLRDYRFYTSDLIHPNQIAIDYIWEKFVENFVSIESQNVLQQWQKIYLGLKHRSQFPNSSSHLKFLQGLLKSLKGINQFVDTKEEIVHLTNQIENFGFN